VDFHSGELAIEPLREFIGKLSYGEKIKVIKRNMI